MINKLLNVLEIKITDIFFKMKIGTKMRIKDQNYTLMYIKKLHYKSGSSSIFAELYLHDFSPHTFFKCTTNEMIHEHLSLTKEENTKTGSVFCVVKWTLYFYGHFT